MSTVELLPAARILIRVGADSLDDQVSVDLAPDLHAVWPAMTAERVLEALATSYNLREETGSPLLPISAIDSRRKVTIVVERQYDQSVRVGWLLSTRGGRALGVDYRSMPQEAVAEHLGDALADVTWQARQNSVEALTRANGAIVELNALLADVADGKKTWAAAAARLDQLEPVIVAESHKLKATLDECRKELDAAGGLRSHNAVRALVRMRTTLGFYDLD